MARILARFNGVIHYHEQSLVYGSINQRIYRSSDGGLQWRLLTTLPISGYWRVLQRLPLGRRFFRAGIRHIVPAGDHLVIFGYGLIYRYHLETASFSPPTRIIGSRPFAVCTGPGWLYYGEYGRNPKRRPVKVLRSNDHGVHWEVAYVFDRIRHIHGIFYDAESDAIWVTTGDEDHESGLWVTTDHFRTVRLVLGGSQRFRVVWLLFTPESVYFGSDTGRIPNALYRYSRRDGKVEALQLVDGPVFYGTRIAGELFFSTVCEPNRCHPTKQLTVWRSTDGAAFRPWLHLTKDCWPKRWFQYGQVLFPAGPGQAGAVWLSAVACCDFKGSMKIILAESSAAGN